MFRLKITFVLLLNLVLSSASAKIDFNKNCNQAFDDIFSLKLPKANEILNAELEKNPQNAYALYLQGLSEVVNVFINENDKSYKKLQASIPDKIKKIDKYGGKSQYTLFFKGQLLFYYGVTQAKFDDFFYAGSNIRDSYITLKNNASKYPAFLPNNTIMGVIETFSGTVPNSYKWIINMFGVKASLKKGMKRLENFANANIPYSSHMEHFKLEAKIFQGGLYNLVLHNEKKGWDLINNCTVNWRTNLFSAYLRSSFLIKTGEIESAIEILTNSPKGPEYTDLKFLDYLLGVSKLSRLDKDADKYLLSYITHFKGRNYLKSALQKLAWFYLINGDFTNYQLYMAKIPLVGYEFTDEDKQASKNAAAKYIPNISLLRSRLLFDGGYYDRAFRELEGKSTKNYAEKRDQVEFIYRLGRINQKQNKNTLAINYFDKAIAAGKNLPYYYAMASSIEIATIYESSNDLVLAKKYYTKALTFSKNKEYVNSLEQRAKAGLSRVSK